MLKMIPNTTSVPDFNSLQHRPRKCKLLWSELVAKHSPEGTQFSALAESCKSLKPAPRVSVPEAFIWSWEGKAGCLYRWCPGALTKSSTPKRASPSEPEKIRKEFPDRRHTLRQALCKEKSTVCQPRCDHLSTAGDCMNKYAEQI